MIIWITPKQVKPNPWGERNTEAAELPVGRWVTRNKSGAIERGYVELASNYAQVAEWQAANPGKPMMVDVMELSDIEMAKWAEKGAAT